MKITEKVSPEFPEYIVRSDGVVLNKSGHMLRQYEKKKYKNVYLYKGKKRYFKLVHRLVAETFIPNNLNKKEINHKDENTRNNCVENLECCDRIYNANYGSLKQRQRERMLNNNPFFGKTHNEETRRKISQKKKKKVCYNKWDKI